VTRSKLRQFETEKNQKPEKNVGAKSGAKSGAKTRCKKSIGKEKIGT
jgi:hypothetical protein